MSRNITGPNNSNVGTGCVLGKLYEEKKYCIHTWKNLCHPVCPIDSHFCLKNSVCPQQRARWFPQLNGGDYMT